MATNSSSLAILERHVFNCWPHWVNVCEHLMLGYSEWRMRCYSETIKTLDVDWNTFKRVFSKAEDIFEGNE